MTKLIMKGKIKLKKLQLILAAVLLLFPIIAMPQITTEKLDHNSLVADVCQLAEIIESTHPDPYSAGGGMIKFNFRLQKLLPAIPEEGMPKDEFVQLLRPFVATI